MLFLLLGLAVVAYTDYDNYAISYSCVSQNADGSCNSSLLFLYGRRNGHVPERQIELLQNYADKYCVGSTWVRFQSDIPGTCLNSLILTVAKNSLTILVISLS